MIPVATRRQAHPPANRKICPRLLSTLAAVYPAGGVGYSAPPRAIERERERERERVREREREREEREKRERARARARERERERVCLPRRARVTDSVGAPLLPTHSSQTAPQHLTLKP